MAASFTPSHRGGSGTPLVLVHGFTDTWRTWDLVLPELEKHHDVLAPTMLGHAGGGPLPDEVGEEALLDDLERAMDEAGFERAHVVGNSLGGYAALQLAARGRAESVVALAPAGGWTRDDPAVNDILDFFRQTRSQLQAALPHVDALLASEDGRRLATSFVVTNFEHIPVELIKHQVEGVVGCDADPLIANAAAGKGFDLDASAIDCPVRIVWGTADRILPYPGTAARYREDLPSADWVELDGIGHMPQLDVPTETAQLILGFTQ